MSTDTQQRIAELVEQLTALQKERLLAFIEAMVDKIARPSPEGLRAWIGKISADDLNQMQKSIDEDQ